MITYDKQVLKKYGLKVFTYRTLPDRAPNGFWAVSNNLIILCPNSLGAHYGAAIIFLSSLGIKRYEVKLNFILKQYGNFENLFNGQKINDTFISKNKILSFEEIYEAMYSPPINAVRVNFEHNQCTIRTPFLKTNKSAVRLAEDIAMLYDKPCDIDTYLI